MDIACIMFTYCRYCMQFASLYFRGKHLRMLRNEIFAELFTFQAVLFSFFNIAGLDGLYVNTHVEDR
jgi:hypothetical protein